ncbi:MAG: sulfatase-like hydrolase/transferase, partial [Deltaproteobacteria bacterium]|nr:sulfatase-like hydrolase/transferase [Deltaproteobacteria bacterium]
MTAPIAPRFPSAGVGIRADLRRGLLMAAGGAGLLLPIEYVATLWAYPGDISIVTALRVLALCATLLALAWVILGPLWALAIASPRLVRALSSGDARHGAGPLAWHPRPDAPRPGAAWVWALFVGGGVFLLGVQRVAAWAATTYKEPQRIGILIAAAAAVIVVVALVVVVLVRKLVAIVAEALYPTTGPWSPFTSWRGAVAGTAALILGGMLALHLAVPAARPDLPWRLVLAAYTIGIGMTWGARRAALPRAPLARRRKAALLGAAAAALIVPSTLVWFGADVTAKYVVVTASPVLDKAIGYVRSANDFDRDGFGSLLGENDCAPFDPELHPGAKEIADDDIDQNCDGHDFSLRSLAAVPSGPRMPVPAAFARNDWNVLFITIDTVRYDHTTFGGYKDGPKHRDTTPNLAKLVNRATSFSFAQAPAAGTMASVPAIITSKFFHNGLALDESNIKPGMPPRLKPENTLITEIMKRGGYATGVILTHEYFSDWGMLQGVDDPDMELTKDTDPFKVTSHLVTDHILAWISRHAGQKWFLWAHYLDPHGRYVAHPDEVDWSATEEDKYDSELFFTDKQLGRLFDELSRLPGGDRTIIVVTADHGDGFNEHGFINHGQALYRELLNVPMIIYVPDNQPRVVPGATSPLDLVPTIADLTGIDVSDLAFEGKSLVPQLFYQRDDMDRVVFSETNWPKRLRSATSAAWKLIYNIDDNLYELYDLKNDPWEKVNAVSKDKDAYAALKTQLDAFLERVVFARDPANNQIAMRIAEVLLASPPKIARPVSGVSFDDGRIELLGWEPESPGPYKPGEKLYAKVYFAVHDTPSAAFRLQLEAWPMTGALDPAAAQPNQIARSPLRLTLDGLFSSDRWRKGDTIRERIGLFVGNDWKAGDQLAIGLWMTAANGKRATPTGPTVANDPGVTVLGTVPFAPPPPPPGQVAPVVPGAPGAPGIAPSGPPPGAGSGALGPTPPAPGPGSGALAPRSPTP